jgi:hypothetical protein
MVKTIQPDENSSSARSTPIPRKSPPKTNNFDQQIQPETSVSNPKSSLLSNILSPLPTTNNYADVKMAAQHREIERLVDSRQRLHTIKDQIASLHQSMTTPPIQSKNDQTNTYEENLNDSENLRHQEESSESELDHFEYESDNDTDHRIQTKPRMKQSVCLNRFF